MERSKSLHFPLNKCYTSITMRRALIALLLSACCVSVFALEVTPPAPDSQTFFKIVAHTQYCDVQRTDVSVQGFNITVELTPSPLPVACPASFAPTVASVGVLPPGVYDVSVRVAGGAEVEHQKIIVRDGTSGILVSPVGSRPEGGRDVQVFGA